MPVRIEARRLSGIDTGKTVSMYCRDTRRSCTIEILAIEQWPDETIIHLPTDINQDPYHLDPTQTVLIEGQPTPPERR